MARKPKKAGTLTQDPKLYDLYIKKLESSGLTPEDGVLLGFDVMTKDQVLGVSRYFEPLGALKLSYFDPWGEPASDWPNCPPYYRLRYLEEGTGFNAQTDRKKPRYVQPPDTLPLVYYPTNQPWAEVIDDVKKPLIITEGELKAAKACKEGFPTIGLGGVYSYRSTKHGVSWLACLDAITWPRRYVYLCFDSDIRSNQQVQSALRELADELVNRGSYVSIAYLPQFEDGQKVGIDDFFVYCGANGVKQFEQVLHEAEPYGFTKVLWSMNDRYLYVRHPGLVLDKKTMVKTGPTPFKDHLESTKQYTTAVIKDDGSITYKRVAAAGEWLKWPYRGQVDKITYLPGKPQYIEEKGQDLYNTWPGWGVLPKPGDVKPFFELLNHLFTGAEPGAKEWFLRWCAYPLQHPGVKMYTSTLIHGRRHGTGKSLIGYTLGKIYGQNFTEIKQGDLHSDFNEWAESKQFVLADDVTGSNKRQEADVLKKMITQRKLRINTKYVPSYEVPDCINYYFTSNHPDSFFLEDDDRRAFIHEVMVGPLSEEFYVEYDLWLETGGAEAVFDYFLRLDLGDFNPAAPAFYTSAKDRMIADGQSDLGAWVRQLIASPDYVLKVGEIVIKKDLFTNKDLMGFYDPSGSTKVTANGLGRELRRAGVPQVAGGVPIKLTDGSQDRYYIVRNHDKWLKASLTEIKKYLEKLKK